MSIDIYATMKCEIRFIPCRDYIDVLLFDEKDGLHRHLSVICEAKEEELLTSQNQKCTNLAQMIQEISLGHKEQFTLRAKLREELKIDEDNLFTISFNTEQYVVNQHTERVEELYERYVFVIMNLIDMNQEELTKRVELNTRLNV